MKLQKIHLKNFRNVKNSFLEPGAQLNFLFGLNGQGKTSFIEAISYFATLRSFRGAKIPEIIRWGEKQAEISCVLSDADQRWNTDIQIQFSHPSSSSGPSRSTKVALINGKSYSSSTQFLSQRFGNFELGFHAVVFNPSDHDLVRGDPSGRRQYLDRVLCAEDVQYLKICSRFQKLLDQRNSVLKNAQSPQRALLRSFTEPWVQEAALLSLKRLEWVKRLQGSLNDQVRKIAPQQPDLSLRWISSWMPKMNGISAILNTLEEVHFSGQDTLPSLQNLEHSLWEKLNELEASEWRSGHTLVGPHRDDWAFFLGQQLLKGHGSQGEVRSALLALKLCEVELFRKATGHRPLFLLDDFSSELDRERRTYLLSYLVESDLQVFVTTTEDGFLQGHPLSGKSFWLSEGQVEQKNSSRLNPQ